MDILQAARKLRPGTSWNLMGVTLSQAEDGSPKVVIPSKEELQAVMDSEAPVPTLQERIAKLEMAIYKKEP